MLLPPAALLRLSLSDTACSYNAYLFTLAVDDYLSLPPY